MSASRGSADKHATDEVFLIAIGHADGPLGTVEEHSLKSGARDVVTRTANEVQADWTRVVNQASKLVSSARAAVDGYELDEVTFDLGFTGAGRIAFVASAEVAMSISVTFRRHSTPLDTGSPRAEE
jgi:hypothetical protein